MASDTTKTPPEPETTASTVHKIVHSPGPWRRDGEASDEMRSAVIRDARGFAVAHSRSWLVEQYEANANAIAAVPELIASLVDAIRLIEHLGGNASNQQKALAKATKGVE